MVNFKRLADRAKQVKGVVDAQGGTEVLKDKAKRVKDVASGPGTMSERARAAAEVAREKPPPGNGDPADPAGPMGGGSPPPPVSGATGPKPPAGSDDPPAGGSK